jgi:hypothetical protein
MLNLILCLLSFRFTHCATTVQHFAGIDVMMRGVIWMPRPAAQHGTRK